MEILRKCSSMIMVFMGLLVFLIVPAWAQEEEDVKDEITNQTIMIDRAVTTLDNFLVDKNLAWFRQHIGDSYGIIIMPQLIKGGFIFGGSGGRGVLIARDNLTEEWSQPVFLTSLGVSWGLQIGGKSSQVIVLIRTERGLEEFYTSSINLGAEGSIAVGPYGASGAAATAPTIKADYLSFAKSKGAFAGLSFDGANIRIDNKWNKEYYGKEVRPVEIIVSREVSNPKSAKLVEAVERASKTQ
jgi:lipid-binding SYLF domain-containing protein